MEKKYEILKDTEKIFFGRKIYKKRALKDFGNVKKGDIARYVESKQNGNSLIYDKAKVWDDAKL